MQLLAEGLGFPEGPVAVADGTFLVTEIRAGTVTRVAHGGSKTVVARLGAGPNGAAIGPDGALYVCNNGNRFGWIERDGVVHTRMDVPPDYVGGSIHRVDLASGEFTDLYTHADGRRLIAPNDIVFDRQGGFWFTDFGGIEGETLALGSVYYGRIDGAPLTRARKGLFGPNGIGLSPDETTLYIAETFTGRLLAADIEAPGRLARSKGRAGRVLVTLADGQAFDSLAVEALGNICVASVNPGAITVVSPDGGLVEQIACPDTVTTNLCFTGPDHREAIITASSTGRLYRMPWPRPGLRLNFSA